MTTIDTPESQPANAGPTRRLLGWAVAAFLGVCTILTPAVAATAVATPDAPAAPVQVVSTTEVEPGTVRIDTNLPVQQAVGAGTGIVLSPDGLVLTNNHVIRGATDIAVTNVGNGQTYPADVVGYDRQSDLAVLQLRGATNLPVAPLGDSSRIRVGDQVTGVGFPGGAGLTRTPGTVRAVDRSIVANDDLTGSAERLSGLIGVEADIRPGDSGGPLVDGNGEVVGIVVAGSATYRMNAADGFAIPVGQAMAVSDAIHSGNAAAPIHIGPTAILGIAVGSARSRAGVPVQGVLRGGPADQAGISSDDVITAIDQVATPDGTALTDVLDGHRPGDTVTVGYLDGRGTPRSAQVILVDGPPN